MTCSHCKLRVENAFNNNGYFAKVNLKKNIAEVYSKQPFDNAKIKAIVERAGYKYVN